MFPLVSYFINSFCQGSNLPSVKGRRFALFQLPFHSLAQVSIHCQKQFLSVLVPFLSPVIGSKCLFDLLRWYMRCNKKDKHVVFPRMEIVPRSYRELWLAHCDIGRAVIGQLCCFGFRFTTGKRENDSLFFVFSHSWLARDVISSSGLLGSDSKRSISSFMTS